MGVAFISPQMQAVDADAPNFLDMSRFGLLVVREEDTPLPSRLNAFSRAATPADLYGIALNAFSRTAFSASSGETSLP